MKHWQSISLIAGALLSLVVEYLFLQTHGPYEAALNKLVRGLNHHDYSRWAVFPALLILPGCALFTKSGRIFTGAQGFGVSACFIAGWCWL